MNDLLKKLDLLPPDIKKEFIEAGLLASHKRKKKYRKITE